jgi:hypothetical protein
LSADIGITWDFDPKGREPFQLVMRIVGYTERDSDKEVLQLLIDKKKVGGFWCHNCEYFQPEAQTVTGAQCSKYGFPDRAQGCCAGHERKNE